jgi:pyrimidine-nucleoside phosphorylase
MIYKQGGDGRVVHDFSLFKKAETVYKFTSPCEGYISGIKTDMLGTASMILGAGRETRESGIDYSAGILLEKKAGTKVEKGEILALLHTNRPEKLKEVLDILTEAYSYSAEPPVPTNLIKAYVDSKGVRNM